MNLSAAGAAAPRVVIVVLNYEKRDDVLACLSAVSALEYPQARTEVVVVDNGSTDGSASAIAEAFPQYQLIRSAHNSGAPAGRNLGWRAAEKRLAGEFEHVFFLDDDAVPAPRALVALVERLERDPSAGIACGKGFADPTTRTLLSIGMHCNLYTGAVHDLATGEVDRGQHDRDRVVPACSAFGFLIRRQLLVQVGGFDEGYSPYGWEDVDLCLRVRALGKSTVYVHRAEIWHKGCSFGRGRIAAYERSKMRNYLRFLRTHVRGVRRITCAICVPVRALRVIASTVRHGGPRVVVSQLQGFWEGLRLPGKSAEGNKS